jgi:hypothetical protein
MKPKPLKMWCVVYGGILPRIVGDVVWNRAEARRIAKDLHGGWATVVKIEIPEGKR